MKVPVLALLLLLLSGCLAQSGPAHEGDAAMDNAPAGPAPAPQDEVTVQPETHAPAASKNPNERVVWYDGQLTYGQIAAINCPLYLMTGLPRTNSLWLDLSEATSFDFTFDWTPAAPPFLGASLTLIELRDGVLSTLYAHGTSPLRWNLAAHQMAEFAEPALKISGPYCPEGAEPLQIGIAYEQAIHYNGTVTYAA